MKLAICPGSFDPITNGHLDVIQRAAKLFDRVIVLVAVNSEKHAWFSPQERQELICRATAHLPNVEVDTYAGLLADYARQKQAVAIVKGLRAMSDFEYEFQMALTNHQLNNEVETVFLTTAAEYMYLSSSLVKEVARLGGDIAAFVPPPVRSELLKKVGRNDNS